MENIREDENIVYLQLFKQEIVTFIHVIFIPILLSVIFKNILIGVYYIGLISFIYLVILKNDLKTKILFKYLKYLFFGILSMFMIFIVFFF